MTYVSTRSCAVYVTIFNTARSYALLMAICSVLTDCVTFRPFSLCFTRRRFSHRPGRFPDGHYICRQWTGEFVIKKLRYVKRRLSVTNLSNNLLMFRLNAPVVIRAFNWNVGKLSSELKLVPNNLLFIYAEANWEATESCRYSQELVFWNLVRCFYGIRHSSIFRLGLLDCSLMSRLHRLTGRINSLVTQFKFPTLASAFKTNGHFATPRKARFYYYIRKLAILQSDWSPTTFWQ